MNTAASSAAALAVPSVGAAATDKPILELLNVESAYGPIKAIRGVSLKVRRGEIATVLAATGRARPRF